MAAKTRKKLEIEFDPSNRSYHVAYIEILRESCAWVMHTEWGFPSRGAAMSHLREEIDGEWTLAAPGIHEASLKRNNNYGRGARRALKVRIKSLMILQPEDCESNESLLEEGKRREMDHSD